MAKALFCNEIINCIYTVLWFFRFEFVYSKLAKTNISNFLKLAHARPLVYFCFFQTNNTIFLTNKCEKCPSGFRCWDTNPQPLVHESSPVTTRLGFPPNVILLNYPLYLCSCKLQVVFSPFCTLTAFQFREKEWTRNVVLTASASSIFTLSSQDIFVPRSVCVTSLN